MSRRESDHWSRPELRWTFGCLVAFVGMTGLVILVFLVALALQPPEWVQVLVGIGLACGGAILAWLVAAALRQSRSTEGIRNRGREENGRRLPPIRGSGGKNPH